MKINTTGLTASWNFARRARRKWSVTAGDCWGKGHNSDYCLRCEGEYNRINPHSRAFLLDSILAQVRASSMSESMKDDLTVKLTLEASTEDLQTVYDQDVIGQTEARLTGRY
jgi:hypothetical protein